MDFEQITTNLTDGVLTITLSRPECLNAWTAQMEEEPRRAFDVADTDDEVRAVIVTGAGSAGRRMTGAGCQARAAAALRRLWNRRRVGGDDRVEWSWMVTA
jgi:enoyl-CoA hydratase/carnithine racemase